MRTRPCVPKGWIHNKSRLVPDLLRAECKTTGVPVDDRPSSRTPHSAQLLKDCLRAGSAAAAARLSQSMPARLACALATFSEQTVRPLGGTRPTSYASRCMPVHLQRGVTGKVHATKAAAS